MSTPALAQTKPCRVLAIITPRSIRTILLDSLKTTSISLGSFWYSAAHRSARSEGLIESRRTVLPSALDTIFWATTTTSPLLGTNRWRWAASTSNRDRSSPGTTSGSPVNGMICTGRGDGSGSVSVPDMFAESGIGQTSIRDRSGQGERRGVASFRDKRSQISAAAGCAASKGAERPKNVMNLHQ